MLGDDAGNIIWCWLFMERGQNYTLVTKCVPSVMLLLCKLNERRS